MCIYTVYMKISKVPEKKRGVSWYARQLCVTVFSICCGQHINPLQFYTSQIFITHIVELPSPSLYVTIILAIEYACVRQKSQARMTTATDLVTIVVFLT